MKGPPENCSPQRPPHGGRSIALGRRGLGKATDTTSRMLCRSGARPYSLPTAGSAAFESAPRAVLFRTFPCPHAAQSHACMTEAPAQDRCLHMGPEGLADTIRWIQEWQPLLALSERGRRSARRPDPRETSNRHPQRLPLALCTRLWKPLCTAAARFDTNGVPLVGPTPHSPLQLPASPLWPAPKRPTTAMASYQPRRSTVATRMQRPHLVLWITL